MQRSSGRAGRFTFIVVGVLGALATQLGCAHAPTRGDDGLSLEAPEATLARPLDNDGPDGAALVVRAYAAFRVGDAETMRVAVERLGPGHDPELDALLALARAPASGGLRRIVAEAPTAAHFDPAPRIPIIEVRLGETTCHFIFDTGAELSVIDTRVAERLALPRPPGAVVTASGNAGETSVALALAPRLSVLGVAFADVPVAIGDLSGLPPELGVDGILGVQDLFRRGTVQLDFVRSEIAWTPASHPEGWPLYAVKGRAIVAALLAARGGAQGAFRIDTGGRRSVLTNAYVDAALAAGADWKVSAPEAVKVQALGTATRSRRTVAELEVCAGVGDIACPIHLSRVQVDTTAADNLFDYAGKLGADAFAGHRLELDYGAHRLRLDP